MKKFKRLFLSLCVVCLTLFVLPGSINASTITYKPYLVALDGSVIDGYSVNLGTNTAIAFNESVNRLNIDVSNISVKANHKYYVYVHLATAPHISNPSATLSIGNSGYVDGVWEEGTGKFKFNIPYTSSDSTTGYLRIKFDSVNTTGTFYITLYSFSLTDGGTIDDTINGGINNVQNGISNIQSSITTINSDIVAINSNITGVNNSLSQFESNVEKDFEQLRNTMSEESSNISNSISSFENSFIENITFVNEGIANAWKTSQSIESFVKQIIDLIQTTNSNLSFIYTDMGKWFGECIDWYDLILRQLINIQSQTVTNTNDLINSLGAHDSALALNLSNLGNSLLNGMNTLNTDIQNQMITQTSNITNNIVAQTNALNSSIKTMENSVTTKLDDTLVIKDKSGVDSNDSSTEDLESAITDYDNVEKNFVTDFNESLDAIDTDSSSSIYSQNDFIKTAQFISTNMQNVYDSNDFVGGMIDVTLLLGLIFTVIGIGVR